MNKGFQFSEKRSFILYELKGPGIDRVWRKKTLK